MTSRKHKILEKRKENREQLRFTPKDIVRAIEGVEAAGLPVYGVEISPTGSIKIITATRSDPAIVETNDANPQAETKPTKKQA